MTVYAIITLADACIGFVGFFLAWFWLKDKAVAVTSIATFVVSIICFLLEIYKVW